MDWTEELIARLRALWDEGHSTAEIGRRLGVSKNAVVGKAHRLALPARPSPIRRAQDGVAAPTRTTSPRRVPAPAAAATTAAPESDEEADVVAEVPVRPALRPVPPPVRTAVRTSPCCWPIGEPGTEDFHFCGAAAITGKPYCTEHAQLAYVKVRDRREEAA